MQSSTIVLDLKRNRYFGIGQKETQALSTLALNWDDAHVQSAGGEALAVEAAIPMAAALVEAGLLSRDAPNDPVCRTGRIDLHGMLTSVGYELGGSAAMRWRHVVSFVRSLLWTRRALRSRTLYCVVRELTERKAAAQRTLDRGSFDAQRAIELVGIFRRLRPHAFTARDRCLFHALALVKFLSDFDVFPTWVIGVRIKPWAAHSWVQEGTLLLDANPEQVCDFAPILAV
jgi:transglutaminase superfamily protein